VIAGDREAELTFLAAVRSFPDLAAGRLIVVDIGGGSTEFVLAKCHTIVARDSLPLGSVRLTEAHLHHDPASASELAAIRKQVSITLATLAAGDFLTEAGPELVLIGSAGTVTTLAAMAQDIGTYDPDRVHGFTLSRDALAAQVVRLAQSEQGERKGFAGLDPRRADVILAGAVLLEAIVLWAGVQHVVVSDRGIRWGLAHEALANPVAGD
jgi:exopolyphosphatase/guanosine-5'-triphosphate,3'-diphosphate pyrophosphatase